MTAALALAACSTSLSRYPIHLVAPPLEPGAALPHPIVIGARSTRVVEIQSMRVNDETSRSPKTLCLVVSVTAGQLTCIAPKCEGSDGLDRVATRKMRLRLLTPTKEPMTLAIVAYEAPPPDWLHRGGETAEPGTGSIVAALYDEAACDGRDAILRGVDSIAVKVVEPTGACGYLDTLQVGAAASNATTLDNRWWNAERSANGCRQAPPPSPSTR